MTLQVSDFPPGSTGVSGIAPSTADYSCISPDADSVLMTSYGCDLYLNKGALARPRNDAVQITVSLGLLSQMLTLTVFHPSLSLSIDSNELRRLSPNGCAPSVYETAKLQAEAAFIHPDDPAEQLKVDVTDGADISVLPSGALTVRSNIVTPLAPVAGATISWIAGTDANRSAATVHVSVLDQASCIDTLVPIVSSVSKLVLISASASTLTVQLQVQQSFSDPGDKGTVAVYAQQDFKFVDVTDKV